MNISQNRLFTLVISAVCVLVPSFAFASFDTNLAYGSSDPAVLSLQQFLVAQNYQGSGSWMETGYFGKATAAAVQQFQNQQGINPASGFFGPATRARANQMSSNGNSVSTVTNTNSNDNSIAATIASLRAQIQQLEFQIAALSGGNTNNGNTTTQCTSAPIPTTACSGTWSAATVSNGCTLSWQCVVNTPTTPTTSGTLTASPSSGSSPILIQFQGTFTQDPTSGSSKALGVDFGDGVLGSIGIPYDCITCVGYTYVASHTYTVPGTYTAKAMTYTGCTTDQIAGGCQGGTAQVQSYLGPTATVVVNAVTTPSSTTYPSDFNFDFQYGWGDELNTFNGTYTKFEGVGVPVATAAFSLTRDQMATVYSKIKTALSAPTISAPRNVGTIQLPCNSETLKVQANGQLQTYSWDCTTTNGALSPSFEADLFGWVINAVQGVNASLPVPSGGIPQ